MHQEFRCGLTQCQLSVRVPHKTAVKMSAKAVVSYESSTGKGCTAKFTQMMVGRIQFLEGYWTEKLISLTGGHLR